MPESATAPAPAPASPGKPNAGNWIKRNKGLALIAAAAGGFLIISAKGHKGADITTSGEEGETAAVQLVPVAAPPAEANDLGDIKSGVEVGGDLNSPLQGPYTAPRTGLEPEQLAELIGAIGPYTPAAQAQALAANRPPSHPGYSAPPKHKKHPSKTSSHHAAGLHRVGHKGNLYRNKKGQKFHRVGKGSKSHFAKGPPPKHHAKRKKHR